LRSRGDADFSLRGLFQHPPRLEKWRWNWFADLLHGTEVQFDRFSD